MDFASQNLTAGQLNAIVKKLGGEEGALRLLRGELVVKAVEFTKQVFSVVVDYALSFSHMVMAGKYDRVNSDIVEKHFLVKGEGKATKELHFIDFNRVMSSEAVLVELKKLNLEPGKIEDLLALGATQPDLQRQFAIVALGSVWQLPSDRFVPYLYEGAGGRALGVAWFEGDWSENYRFLVVSKPARNATA